MKRKDILLLLIPTFIIVLLWVVFNVYHSYINSTIPTDVNMQILYIDPDFDLKTIEELKKRQVINPIDTIESQIEQDLTIDEVENTLEDQETPTPTPTTIPSEIGTSSATQEPLIVDENNVVVDEGNLEGDENN